MIEKFGAPRPMKMGNTLSPWRYDAAARVALQSASLRCCAIYHYASSPPMLRAGPLTPQ